MFSSDSVDSSFSSEPLWLSLLETDLSVVLSAGGTGLARAASDQITLNRLK